MSEITVQVPEGEQKQFAGDATVADAIAELLSNKQRKQTVAAGVGDGLVDLSVRLDSLGLETVELRPVTISSDEGLDILRHSTAHLMAKAVLDLYGPDLKVAIGPSISDGFYYDFDRETPFTPDDFEAIEAKMLETARSGLPFEREVVSKTDAIELFEKKGEQYKVELLKEIEGDTVSLYQLGDFVDLCRGPHVPNSSLLQVYKIVKVAGAYWRGDERNSMLQRLYGTAFADKKKLKKYLNDLEEAKKRDHRKLGKELGLFTISEQVGPGLILWQPKGALLRKLIEDYWKDEHYKHDYELLYTPHIAKLDMWKTSGHLDFYNENMFSSMAIDEVQYQLKPMNCPFHIEIYKSQMRSYREFPIRWCELGTVYRYERTGVLHGLMRVRGFTQDDAHIFCRPDQLEDEIFNILDLNLNILETFGFDQYEIYLSTRPEKYVGSEEHWQKSTDALKQALEKRGLEYQLDPGEGVFYGPKIDVKIKDVLGRSWQCSTIQVDFNLPERFEVCYIGEDGKEHQPIMIHRALMGSLERFIGVLIENYAGAFPIWLAPVQARIMNITDAQSDYCEKVYQELRQSGVRIEKDLRNEKLNYKIREAQLAKIPYMLVVGDREVESGTVTVRERSGKNLPPMSVEDFATKIKDECKVVLG
jgi:threonyl-tRNA synthetase